MFGIRFAFASALVLITLGPATAEKLIVPGTGDGLDMLRHVAAVYSEQNPDTLVLVPPSIGSPAGKAAVLQDRAVVGRVAVPLDASDEASGLVAVPIVRVPTTFFIHPGVRVANLTAAQTADIFSGKIRNWSEVGGPNLRVRVVRREETDSTLLVLRATMRGWKTMVFTDRTKLATTTQEAFDAVREHEGAIGFGPYSKGLDAEFTVPTVDGNHPMSPDYPSFTTIRLIFKRDRITNEAKEFVSFAKSAAAAAIYASYGGLGENFEELAPKR